MNETAESYWRATGAGVALIDGVAFYCDSMSNPVRPLDGPTGRIVLTMTSGALGGGAAKLKRQLEQKQALWWAVQAEPDRYCYGSAAVDRIELRAIDARLVDWKPGLLTQLTLELACAEPPTWEHGRLYEPITQVGARLAVGQWVNAV